MAGETILEIVGNLTADPELKATPSGKMVVSFTVVSTPRSFDKQSNGWKDGDPLFMRCSAWGQLAENVAESLNKGVRVMVQGRLTQRSYETKQGEKRTVLELQADEVAACLKFARVKVIRAERGGPGQSQGYGQQAQPQQASAQGADDPWSTGGAPYSDNPPF